MEACNCILKYRHEFKDVVFYCPDCESSSGSYGEVPHGILCKNRCIHNFNTPELNKTICKKATKQVNELKIINKISEKYVNDWLAEKEHQKVVKIIRKVTKMYIL